MKMNERIPTLPAELVPLAPFLTPSAQLAAAHALGRDDATEVGQALHTLATTLATMPRYGQAGHLGDQAVVQLRYFKGDSQWFVTELDWLGDGRKKAYGYVLPHNYPPNAGPGTICIVDLVAAGVELDWYWTPMTLGVLKEALWSRK